MYDVIIVGTGPAGLSAAIYAARFKLNALVIGKELGGVLMLTHKVENWPGIKSISGFDLMQNIIGHVKEYGVEIRKENVVDVNKEEGKFVIISKRGEYECKSVILATGTVKRKLGVPGEREFENKGVHYCASCDGPLYRDKIVGVVGGSDAAATEALLLAEYAKKVYIIYRKEKIRAEPINLERVEKNEKIEIINNSNVIEILGNGKMEKVKLDTDKEMELDGLFVEIGAIPGTMLAAKLGVELNDRKEVIIDAEAKTNVKGVFAAGDLTNKRFKQAIIAAGDAVMAVFSAYNYLKGNK